MTKPYPYFRLVQFGTLSAEQEWSIGLGLGPVAPVTPTNDAMATWLGDAEAATLTWMSGGDHAPNLLMSNDCTYLGNRLYYYPANATSAELVAERLFSSPPAGVGGNIMDQRTSIVASTLTGIAGRSFRGRRYIPCDGATLTLHQLDVNEITGLADAEATLFTTLGAVAFLTTSLQPVIVNNRDFPTAITQVRVDSKLDTQRRRSDKIGALHTISADV